MTARNLFAYLAAAALAMTLAGCATADGESTTTATPENDNTDPKIAAYIGDEEIPMTAIYDKVGEQLEQLHEAAAAQRRQIEEQETERAYGLKRNAIDEMMYDRLIEMEATEQGMTREELEAAEVDGKAEPATDAEIAEVWYRFKDQAPQLQGKSLEESRVLIESQLNPLKVEQRRAEFLDELKESYDVVYVLDYPRVAVDIPANAMTRGPEDAPITVVEYSDYQCGFCKRAHPMMEELLADYSDSVRFVYLDYALPSHPRAIPASAAARCADEQDKFWEYHDNLMTVPGTLEDDDLKARAGTLSLDQVKFDACMDEDRHLESIEEVVAAAEELGISGTPTFFINGRKLVGAQPREAFIAIFEEELKRAELDDRG